MFQLDGNESLVNIDIFKIINIVQAVVDGLDLELAPRMRLQFEDFASDGEVFVDALESSILAERVKFAT